jgi:FKBP-type peptidyl-prolyl cis-trans isomerase
MNQVKNLVLVFLGIVVVISSCEQNVEGPAQLTTYKDSLSYSYGVELAEAMKTQKVDIDPAIVAAAVKECLEDKSQMTLMECRSIVSNNEKRQSAAFLVENATKEGVMTTESGLQYKIIEEGTGAVPTASDVVTVHYTGKLTDGTVFDSSVQRGEPVSFPLNGVIAGWTEGLQLVKEGGKIELYIPSELGYGERGAGGVIPPNATLIFEVELISIEEKS